MLVIPGNHDSRNVGYVHFEELFGERRSELHDDGVLDRGGGLHRARPRPRRDRPRALRVDRGALRLRRRLPAHLRAAPPPAAGAGHRPRAQRRARRRRHPRVPAALGRAPRAVRPQARALRVAAGEPVRGERRNGLHHPAAGQDQALLQRDRDLDRTRDGVPQVPVRRPRAAAHVRPAARSSTRRTARSWARRSTAELCPRRDRRSSTASTIPRRCAMRSIAWQEAPTWPRPRARGRGGEKLPPGALDGIYGRPVRDDPERALRDLAGARTPWWTSPTSRPWPPRARLRLASLALHLGLAYEAPGMRLEPPRLRAAGLSRARPSPVIGTAKRTGKTAVAGHWAGLMRDAGLDPVMVCMGRGGPAEPRVAEAGTALEDLRGDRGGRRPRRLGLPGGRRAGGRAHGGLPAGGWRARRARRTSPTWWPAPRWRPRSIRARCCSRAAAPACPPWQVDRTVCVAGAGAAEPFAEYRLLRADLVLAAPGAPVDGFRFELRPEPVEALAAGRAGGAVHHRRRDAARGWSPVVVSTNLARREALGGDLDRAGRRGLRRLPHRAEGRRHRHGGAQGAGRGRAGGVRAQPPRGPRRRPGRRADGAGAAVAEPIVSHGGHGLPYSKGLTAQSLSASGLSPPRAFELAREVERRLLADGTTEIDLAGLRALTGEVLLAAEGEGALRRWRGWSGLDRLDPPLIVLIGGAAGVGKSTLASMLAARLGITRVIATDVIRQVLRSFFTAEAVPGRALLGVRAEPGRVRGADRAGGHRHRRDRGARLPGAHADGGGGRARRPRRARAGPARPVRGGGDDAGGVRRGAAPRALLAARSRPARGALPRLLRRDPRAAGAT